ncbi:MAG: putative oxidoreductase [Sphingomonas bacterium]|nr:putative oxidoreductase [Sphingomonas bacterium]MDB5717787.1 putative oxidoreductase [Sphingomonas bacterium]
MKELRGRTAFVTGGASGIGLGMVRAFLAEGMKVVVVDRNDALIEEVRGLLQGSNAVHFLRVDVTDRDQVRAAADAAEAAFGRIHVLCNNAGVSGGGAVADPDFDEWDKALAINLGGVVNGVKIIGPRIVAHGEGGHIVNTSSMAGLVPLPDEGGCYSTAKYAIRGLTESLRLSLALKGIGVSCLCPGLTRSRIMEGSGEGSSMARDGDPDALFNTMDGAMDPLEVGEAVVRGIRANLPYILPHSEFRDEVVALHQGIADGFPVDQEVPPARLAFEQGRQRMTEERRHLPVLD